MGSVVPISSCRQEMNMGTGRKDCGSDHRFREHGIGAGLTRKICARCGQIQIGQGRRAILTGDSLSDESQPIFVKAG